MELGRWMKWEPETRESIYPFAACIVPLQTIYPFESVWCLPILSQEMHWGYKLPSFDSFTVDSPQGKPAEQKNTSVQNKPVVGRAVMHFPFIIVLGIKYYNIHLGPKSCVGAETGTWALMKWSRAWQLRIGFFSYSSPGKLSFLLFFFFFSQSFWKQGTTCGLADMIFLNVGRDGIFLVHYEDLK